MSEPLSAVFAVRRPGKSSAAAPATVNSCTPLQIWVDIVLLAAVLYALLAEVFHAI